MLPYTTSSHLTPFSNSFLPSLPVFLRSLLPQIPPSSLFTIFLLTTLPSLAPSSLPLPLLLQQAVTSDGRKSDSAKERRDIKRPDKLTRIALCRSFQRRVSRTMTPRRCQSAAFFILPPRGDCSPIFVDCLTAKSKEKECVWCFFISA